MAKVAFITGITGQDGSYLAESLLADGYRVHGLIRRHSAFGTPRIDHLRGDANLELHHGDLLDAQSLSAILRKLHPDEIYHLGAQSHVRVSFDCPAYTFAVNAGGTLNLLEAARQECPQARIYNASSSEMFGNAPPPQSETTPFDPRSPYAVAKVAAHHWAKHYREAHGMFVASGILFNHESVRRGETFVTRKITRAVARIKLGLDKYIELGNLAAKRDWMHAKDAVRGMRMIVEHEKADDFVLATGETHSVGHFLSLAADAAGLDRERDAKVHVNPYYLRPTEVDCLRGDFGKALHLLGWSPTVGLRELVREMVEFDLKEERKHLP